jgi:DNA-binding Lrp family transcriptional regulator
MTFQDKLKGYIKDLMGLELLLSDWSNVNKLPLFMKKKYEFYNAELSNRKFLVMLSKKNDEMSLRSIKKHIKQLSKYTEHPNEIVFVCSNMSNYGRHSFIKENIPFIVLGLQLYVPFLGIAFKERIEEKYVLSVNNISDSNYSKLKRVREKLTPTAQALYFELITNGTINRTQMEIANNIGISKIAISRGFSLLEEFEIIRKEKIGVKNIHSFTHMGKPIWESIKEYLINPVETVIYIESDSLIEFIQGSIYRSGETALSRVSMLASPRTDTYAMYKSDWDNLEKRPRVLPSIANDSVRVELWSYPIPLLDGEIHPVVLYLTLKDHEDERVQSFLDDLIEKYSWDSIISTNDGIEVLK